MARPNRLSLTVEACCACKEEIFVLMLVIAAPALFVQRGTYQLWIAKQGVSLGNQTDTHGSHALKARQPSRRAFKA
jgi:hypothetical protein